MGDRGTDFQLHVEWFGERLRFARQQAGLSQRTLGYMSGVDQSTISRAERGLIPGLRLELVASLLWCLRDTWTKGSGRPPVTPERKASIAWAGKDLIGY